jgi:Leucine-rich repeat (LRR) protein
MTTSQLERVYLSNNALSGFIPKSFFQLTKLVALDISSNNLVGSLDLTQLWRLHELTMLDLSNNQLHVIDADDDNPVDSSYLSGLQYIGLASCKITQFPSFLRQVKSISYLDLSCNKIGGNVPNWLWDNMWSVGPSSYYVNLSYNMFTSLQLINSGVLPFNRIVEVFDLSFNNFSGLVPMPSSSGNMLEYSNNMFSSLLPNWTLYLRHTNYFSISKNNINDHVPPSICDGHLDILDMSYNNFYGPIPSCLIENVSTILNLRGNNFNGTLPTNITNKCALKAIDLYGNRIEGKLPRGLSNCFDLEVLDIGSNILVDTFPSWLGWLPNLSVLLLRSNKLSGTIGDDNIVGDTKSAKEFFPSLQIIDLSSNNFSGFLTTQWLKRLKSMTTEYNSSGETIDFEKNILLEPLYRYSIELTYKGISRTFEIVLTTVTVIDFSNNRLEGTISEALGNLVSLRILNLSRNAFTGKIPTQLGSMTDLEALDLSCNQLFGEIPQELTDLTFLEILNLSNNHLVGRIPQSHQFSTFGSSSFGGNPGLCGPPLSELPCGASPYTPSAQRVPRSSPHCVDVVLFLFTGLGFGVGFAAAILVKWNRVGRWFCKSFVWLITIGR